MITLTPEQRCRLTRKCSIAKTDHKLERTLSKKEYRWPEAMVEELRKVKPIGFWEFALGWL